MTITKKTRLLAAPFVGTRIRIKLDDPEFLTWGMNELTLAEGHGKVLVDWGDGLTQDITQTGSAQHDYERTGEYEVRISDDISRLRCSNFAASAYRLVYAKGIQELNSNAVLLGEFGLDCFNGAENLVTFHCEKSGVVSIGGRAFRACSSLVGRLDLPRVVNLASTSLTDCIGITELHFAKANEVAISSLQGFESKFGAVNATVSFDL